MAAKGSQMKVGFGPFASSPISSTDVSYHANPRFNRLASGVANEHVPIAGEISYSSGADRCVE